MKKVYLSAFFLVIFFCACKSAPIERIDVEGMPPARMAQAPFPEVLPKEIDGKKFPLSLHLVNTRINPDILSYMRITVAEATQRLGKPTFQDVFFVHENSDIGFDYYPLTEDDKLTDKSRIVRIWCRWEDIFITEMPYSDALFKNASKYYSSDDGWGGLADRSGLYYEFCEYGFDFRVVPTYWDDDYIYYTGSRVIIY